MGRCFQLHTAPRQADLCEVYVYVYDEKAEDNPERLQKVFYWLDNRDQANIVYYEYDEQGCLSAKAVHGLESE